MSKPTSGTKGHRFEFDLDRGISDQVIERLEALEFLPLQKGIGPSSSGVYALYCNGNLVYIGSAFKETTLSERTLRVRLNEHVSKILKDSKYSLSDMEVRFLTFESEWWVVAAEFALIKAYTPEWNRSGFGSKAPGRGRPGVRGKSRWEKGRSDDKM